MEIELQWHGPFTWFRDQGNCLFECSLAETPGIYVWAVPTPMGNLGYYVGQTETGFAARQYDHFVEYGRGAYTINEPVAFAEGRRVTLYRGFVTRKPKWKHAQEFVERSDDLLPIIPRMLRAIRVWFAPLDAKRRVQRRIEGAMVDALYRCGGLAGDFQEEKMRVERRRAEEEPIVVRFTPSDLFVGLPEEVEA